MLIKSRSAIIYVIPVRKVKPSFAFAPRCEYEYHKSAQVSNELGNSLDNEYITTTIIPRGRYIYVEKEKEGVGGGLFYSSEEDQTQLSFAFEGTW